MSGIDFFCCCSDCQTRTADLKQSKQSERAKREESKVMTGENVMLTLDTNEQKLIGHVGSSVFLIYCLTIKSLNGAKLNHLKREIYQSSSQPRPMILYKRSLCDKTWYLCLQGYNNFTVYDFTEDFTVCYFYGERIQDFNRYLSQKITNKKDGRA